MATYNGEKYIKEQLNSILKQLGDNDEVIISDDSSTDNTLAIISLFKDKRIKLFPNQQFHSPVFNFENAIIHSSGDVIFLCDQDDIWEDNKVSVVCKHLLDYSMVVSDCTIVNSNGDIVRNTFYGNKIPSKSTFANILRNHFLGCCMAFRRELLDIALPFPPRIAMHDIWLGLCASAFSSVIFIPDKLIRYRRHDNNASPTSERSKIPYYQRIKYRLYCIVYLIKRKRKVKKQ